MASSGKQAGAASAARADATSAATKGVVSPADAMQRDLLAALREPNITDRMLRLAAVMQLLTRDNWAGALAAFAEEKEVHGRDHADIRLLFAQRAGEVVGLEAVQHFLKGREIEAARSAITGWAIKNPTAVLEWMAKDAGPDVRKYFMGAAIRGLALTEPDLAVAEFENIPLDRRKNYTNRLVDSLVRAAGIEGADALVAGMIKRAAQNNTLKDEYLSNVFWDLAQAKIQHAQATGNVQALAEWVQSHVGQPYVNPHIVGSVVDQLTRRDPQKAFQWLESYNQQNLAAGQPKTVGYDYLMQAWTRKEGLERVGNWLGQISAHPHYDRITHRYATILATKDATTATRWANTIKDQAIKAEALQQIRSISRPKG